MRWFKKFARTQTRRKRGKMFPDKSVYKGFYFWFGDEFFFFTIIWKMKNAIVVWFLFQLNEI